MRVCHISHSRKERSLLIDVENRNPSSGNARSIGLTLTNEAHQNGRLTL